ncbi:aspartate/glutamate racemase family protein [Myxosarcina sp. GI1(2024)]
MNTVGIVGGIAPESTIEYYRLIVSSYSDHEKNGNYPSIIINSINMKKMLDLIGENRLNEVVEYLASEVNKLAKAGADFAVLASNTPHIVFDEVQKASLLPMISIVEATCEKAREIGMQKVGLFGTKFTMMSGFYDRIFTKQNIEVIVPDEKDRVYIHEKYMNELVKGIFLDKTRNDLLNIVTKIEQQHEIQGLILGGTELPLILTASGSADIPFLDTTKIHVESILKKLT